MARPNSSSNVTNRRGGVIKIARVPFQEITNTDRLEPRHFSRISATTPGRPGSVITGFRSGGWQVFALNSNADLGMRNMQAVWLRNEMVAQPSQCALAYFHHPRFSSGSHGTVPPPPVVPEMWRDLHAAGVDVIIAAHEHFYERFAPQTPDGSPDDQFGIRQFIVGTGGAPLTQTVRRVANSEIVISAFGILRLTLEAQSYRWEFIAADAGAVLDSGSGRCHGKP